MTLKESWAIIAAALLWTACLVKDNCFADGGGDGYHFGASNGISLNGAGLGQLPLMGQNNKIRWTNPEGLPRANYNVSPVVLHGATGTMAWSMPEQGAGYKKCILVFLNYTNPSNVPINFSVPFDRGCSITFSNIAGTNLTTIDTNSVIIPALAVPVTGTMVIEGI